MTTTIIGIKACFQFEADLKLSDLRILLAATREAEKKRRRAPDIFIAPQIRNIRALEFYNAATVFEQAAPAAKQLEDELTALLSA